MSRRALLAATAGAALLTAPLGAEAYTYHRPASPGWAPGGMHAMPRGYGYRPMMRAAGYGYRPMTRPYGYRPVARVRYGYRHAFGAAVGYGYGAGYGAGYGYAPSYNTSQTYGYGYRSTAYATGPYYAPAATGSSCGCTTTAYQPASTIAYVPVTTYKAVRVYYAPQQQPYYNVPPYLGQ